MTLSSVFAQTTIQVFAAQGRQILPYATISNLSTNIIYSANASGEAIVYCETGDSLQITYVGYYKQEFRATKNAHKKIYLRKKEQNLPVITIASCKKYELFRFSNSEFVQSLSKMKMNGTLFGGFDLGSGLVNKQGQVAIHYQSDVPNVQLSSFSFYTQKIFSFSPKNAPLIPVICHFYAVDTITGKPGDLLAEYPVICYPKKIGKQTIKVDSLGILIPPEGIFIGFQYILDDKYKWEMKIPSSITDTDSTVFHYGGLLEGVFVKTRKNYCLYDVKNDSWFSPFPSRGHLRMDVITKRCVD